MVKDIDINEMTQRFVKFEGCEEMPYICPMGYKTIGVGRNLQTNPLTAEEKKVCGDYEHGITKNMAFYLLRHDIERVKGECEKNIPFFNRLDAERRYALLDMCFNMGIKTLCKFQLMLGAMGVGNWDKAADECLRSRYATQTGKRAKIISETIRTGVFMV